MFSKVAQTLLFITLIATTLASPITFVLKKGEQECFYTLTTDLDCSITYYFAVQQGRHGEESNVDYQIFGPGDKYAPLLQRKGESLGEFSFLAEHRGEYKFCFEAGSDSTKEIDLEIRTQCNRADDERSKRQQARKEQRNLGHRETDSLGGSLEDSVDQIERRLYQLENTMEYYKTRNIRNHRTVRSTDRRIVKFSIYGILLIALMGVGQITILQWFFEKARKQVV